MFHGSTAVPDLSVAGPTIELVTVAYTLPFHVVTSAAASCVDQGGL